MAITGPKPKGNLKQTQTVAHDWVEVENVPFRAKPPVHLPLKRRILDPSTQQMRATAWEPLTRQWWKAITSMPHCVLWTAADWNFALVTAVVADNVFRGGQGAAGELRQREAVLGTTIDARRDLRIRYVAKVAAPKVAIVPSTVTSIDVRRQRSTGGDDSAS